ncbi:MAG: DUF2785 domain-containing protein [Planctomycetes bacterium]|nr:DUF2785 domain-containing protein [Planctomycetota bacterium]
MRALALLFAFLPLSCRSAGAGALASAHDKPFWRAIVAANYAPPQGADVPELARELAATAGSTDPELRDELGFEISSRWVRRPGILGDEDVRALLNEHLEHIHEGLGEGEGDGVFLRAFSALHLAQFVARDLRTPYLDDEQRARLVHAACRVLREERDRRGWVVGKGWAHAIAHSADLLANLAREPQLTPQLQSMMLDALDGALEGAYSFGESGRLAAVLAYLATRADFVEPELERHLAQWAREAKEVWTTQPFDPAAFHKAENVKSLLKDVLLGILLDPKASESERKAADAIRAAFFGG